MTVAGGFFSLCFWVLITHMILKYSSKFVNNLDLAKNSSLSFDMHEERKEQIIENGYQILAWLKRILYGKSFSEASMTIVTCFLGIHINHCLPNRLTGFIIVNNLYIMISSGKFS